MTRATQPGSSFAEWAQAVPDPGTSCLAAPKQPEATGEASAEVDRWAASIRKAHWYEDPGLSHWWDLCREQPDVADFWRRVARAAIAAMENDYLSTAPTPGTVRVELTREEASDYLAGNDPYWMWERVSAALAAVKGGTP